MSRLSIELTPEQHHRLKAIAALSGRTIREYVLERVLPPEPEPEGKLEEEKPKEPKPTHVIPEHPIYKPETVPPPPIVDNFPLAAAAHSAAKY